MLSLIYISLLFFADRICNHEIESDSLKRTFGVQASADEPHFRYRSWLLELGTLKSLGK